jgi:hypothetical protein
MCKPWKHQDLKGSGSPQVLGARNFRLTQDKLQDLLGEESSSQIAREVCVDESCECNHHFDAEAYEEALLEAVTGETAKKLASLNVTVSWAT